MRIGKKNHRLQHDEDEVNEVYHKRNLSLKWLLLFIFFIGVGLTAGFVPYLFSMSNVQTGLKVFKVDEEYIRENRILYFEDHPTGVITNHEPEFEDTISNVVLDIDVNHDMINVDIDDVIRFTVKWDNEIQHVDITITHRDLNIIVIEDDFIENNLQYEGQHTVGSIITSNIPFTTNFNDGLPKVELHGNFTNSSANNGSLKNGDDISVIFELKDLWFPTQNVKSIIVAGLLPFQLSITQADIEHLVDVSGTKLMSDMILSKGEITTEKGVLNVELSVDVPVNDLVNDETVTISVEVISEPDNFQIIDVEYTISGLTKRILNLDEIEIEKQLEYSGYVNNGTITSSTFVTHGVTVSFTNNKVILSNGDHTDLNNLSITSDAYELSQTTIEVKVTGIDLLEIILVQSDIESLVHVTGDPGTGVVEFHQRDDITTLDGFNISIGLSSPDSLVDLTNGSTIDIKASLYLVYDRDNFVIKEVIKYTVSGLLAPVVINNLNDYIEDVRVDSAMNVYVEWNNLLPTSFQASYPNNLDHSALYDGINFTITPEDGYRYAEGIIHVDVSSIVIDEVDDTITLDFRNKYSDYLTKDGSIIWASIPDITSIAPATFNSMITLTGLLSIPNTVTSIGHSAFLLTSITALDLGNNIETIGHSAFSDLAKLEGELRIPDSVITIGSQAFYNTSISSLYLGENIKSIGTLSFGYTRDLKSALAIPDSVITIGDSAFEASSITSLTLGSGLETIGDDAFNKFGSWNNLTGTLVIPDSVTSIGKSAFLNATITSLTLGSGLKTIGADAFDHALRLTGALVIPNSVTSIGDRAFSFTAISSLTLGSSLKTIGDNAFSNITSLNGWLKIPNSVTTIGYEAFKGVRITNLTLGAGLQTIESFAFSYISTLTIVLWVPNHVSLASDAFFSTNVTVVR